MSIFRPFIIRRIHLVLLGMLLTLLAAGGVAQASTTAQATTPKVMYRSTGELQDFGDTFSKTEIVTFGPGFRAVSVQLTGWSFRYASGDHHIQTARVKINNVQPDFDHGTVKFTINGAYRDVNGDDDFVWAVDYVVLALP